MAYAGQLVTRLGLDKTAFSSGLQSAVTESRTAGRKIADSFNKEPKRAVQDFEDEAMRATWNVRGAWKDVGRVITGIVIAQGFYKVLNIVEDIGKSMMEFAEQTEVATVSFKTLLGTQQDAEAFDAALQNFAAKTPFQVAQTRSLAREMLGMGFDAKQVIPILRVLSDTTAAMGGDTDVLNRVVMSIGQMKTAGKITGREMRELAMAGIPVYQILQDKLGLTAEQLDRIGAAGIDANTGLNALLQGMSERFAGGANAISQTVKGMYSTIADNFLIVTNKMFEGAYNQWKGLLTNIVASLDNIQQAYAEKGLGGMWREIVPPGLRLAVNGIYNSFRELSAALHELGKAIQPVANGFKFLIWVLGSTLPVIAYVLHAIATLISCMINGIPGLGKFIGILLGLTVTAGLTTMVLALGSALLRLTGITMMWNTVMGAGGFMKGVTALFALRPATFVVLGLAAALAILYTYCGGVRKALGGIGKTISGASGFKQKDLFATATRSEELKKKTAEYTKGMGLVQDAVKNVGEEAEKTGKKIKLGVLSFDEVYNLTKDAATTGADDTTGFSPQITPNVTWPEDAFNVDWDKVLGDQDINFDDYTDRIATKFKKSLNRSLIGAGIGALLGFLLGSMLGNPVLGAKLGALAGGIIGLFWEDLKKALEYSDTQMLGQVLAVTLGAALGAVLGGPLGAVLMAAIAGYAYRLVQQVNKELVKAFDLSSGAMDLMAFSSAIGAVIGAAIGMVIGGPMGAVIGAALGLLAGDVVGMLVDKFKNDPGFRDTGSVCTALGTLIGGAIGFVLGGPVGAIIGAALGALSGGLVALLVEKLQQDPGFSQSGLVAATIGTLLGAAIGFVLGGPIGAIIGGAIGNLTAGIVTLIVQDLKETEAFKDSGIIPKTIATLLGAAIGGILGGPFGAILGGAIGLLVGGIIEEIRAAFEGEDEDEDSDTKGKKKKKKHAAYATGGIINKEQLIRVGEGNKREAVVPLENAAAMQPFADAVSYGIMSSLLPILAGGGSSNGDININAGVLVADDYGLKELERRLLKVRQAEATRR